MIGLLLVGVVAGVIAGISPCVLPVLPVIFVAGAADKGGPAPTAGQRRRRALAVVAGIIVSFTVFTLAAIQILHALHLPDDFVRWAGIVVLGVLGLSFVVPQIGERVEALFAHIPVPRPRAHLGGFVLGVSTGAVFVPCAGPVLTTITTLGDKGTVGFWTVVLTLCFSLGAGVPLLIIALAGDALVRRVTWLRTHTGAVRRSGGAILIAMSVVIGLNWIDGIQRVVPGYTNALQNSVERTAFAHKELLNLDKGKSAPATGAALLLQDCLPDDAAPENCGIAPRFREIDTWLNTPDHRAIDIDSLRGKVVLVDFYTYSCINCQREIPHVEAWYQRYHRDGLDVLGVSTPEFAFEHVVSNVTAGSRALGITYPIAIDNNAATFAAYDNDSWPASYLVNASGQITHLDIGEGDYSETESLLRAELLAANPRLHLPPGTDTPDRTPMEATTPESYLGTYYGLQNLENVSEVVLNRSARYTLPSSIAPNEFGIGGSWSLGAQAMTAVANAELELRFVADDVYLVIGGHGTLTVRDGNGPVRTIEISGIPRLYTLVSGSNEQSNLLQLHASPGVMAYDFTFG